MILYTEFDRVGLVAVGFGWGWMEVISYCLELVRVNLGVKPGVT